MNIIERLIGRTIIIRYKQCRLREESVPEDLLFMVTKGIKNCIRAGIPCTAIQAEIGMPMAEIDALEQELIAISDTE